MEDRENLDNEQSDQQANKQRGEATDRYCIPSPSQQLALGRETPRERVAQIPALEFNLQALSINEPEIFRVQAEQEIQEQGADAEFNILMKLACTGGQPRVISLQAVQQSMARAWKQNYYGVSQFSRYIFVAHFRSLEAVMFVITRQPWSMGSDNFLLEWMDPEDETRGIEDYQFSSIYVTIRIYGIPRRYRSTVLLSSILQGVGEISEFHPINQAMLFARQEYIWGTVRIQVNKAVKDKVLVTFTKDCSGMAYLFYERIGRICTFCGVMFHSVQHCNIRNNILMSRHRVQILPEEIAPNRYGKWMTNADLIPQNSDPDAEHNSEYFSSFRNPQLARLQRQFVQDPKGKGKAIDQDSQQLQQPKELSIRKINAQIRRLEAFHNMCQGQGCASTTGVMHGCQLPQAVNPVHAAGQRTNVEGTQIEFPNGSLNQIGTLVDPTQAGGNQGFGPMSQEIRKRYGLHIGQQYVNTSQSMESGVFVASRLDGIPNPGGNPPPSNSIPPFPIRVSPKKSSDSILGAPPPPAKKQLPSFHPHKELSPVGSDLQGASPRPSTQDRNSQNILRDSPASHFLANSRAASGTLAAAATRISTTISSADAGAVAGPSRATGADASQHRTRVSRWDISPREATDLHSNLEGSLRSRPGCASWKRHSTATQMGSGNFLCRSKSQAVGGLQLASYTGDGRSPLGSGKQAGASYDQWAIRIPSPTHSEGTVSSRQGAFSPPGLDHHCYLDMDDDRHSVGAGAQDSVLHQNVSSVHQGSTLDIQQGQVGDTMDVDRHMDHDVFWAAAHGPNAPRAP